MPAIRYEAPTSIPEAIRLMQADPAASVMAGGTDLLVQFRAGVKRPSAFIDIKRIPDLVQLSIDSNGLRLGAAVSAAELGENAEFDPALAGTRRSCGVNRIHADPGAQIARRKPVQRLASGRYAVLDDRESRRVRHRGAGRGAHDSGRAVHPCAGKNSAGARRISGDDSRAASQAAYRRCVSSVDAAIGNGHCRCGFGGEPDARHPWRVYCGASGARGRCAHTSARAGCGRRRSLAAVLTTKRCRERQQRRALPPGPSTTSVERSHIGVRLPAC